MYNTAELAVTEYLRACRRGIGPTACTDFFDFPVLFLFTLDPPTASLFGVPVSPIHTLVLNVWWVTREIETSAAWAIYVRVDRAARVVTWLPPLSKRDPFAAGEARCHGCACVTERSPAYPYHATTDFAVLVEKFGAKIRCTESLTAFVSWWPWQHEKPCARQVCPQRIVIAKEFGGSALVGMYVASRRVVACHLERVTVCSIVREVGLDGGGTVYAGFSIASSTPVRCTGNAVVLDSASLTWSQFGMPFQQAVPEIAMSGAPFHAPAHDARHRRHTASGRAPRCDVARLKTIGKRPTPC